MEFTTTACNRIEIVERTLASFTANMQGIEWEDSTLYINIDPAPVAEGRDELEAMCRNYFGNVVARKPDTPNYTAAYKWVWAQPKGDFFFNLEDDWILTEKVHINSLVQGLEEPHKIGAVCRAYPYHYKSCPTSPTLYRTSYFHMVSSKLDITKNPETQLHEILKKEHRSGDRNSCPSRRVVIYPYGAVKIIVKDIGRLWSEKTGYTRPQTLNDTDPRYKKKCHFTSWVKK